MSQHIAVVTTSYSSAADDSQGHFVAAEVEELLEAGHSVTVIAPGRSAEQNGRLHILRVGGGRWFGPPGALTRLANHPAQWLHVVQFVAEARAALAGGRFDRAVAHWLVPCGWPIATAASAHVELVAHGSDVRVMLALPRPVATRVVRRWLERDMTVRFVAQALRQQLAEHTVVELLARSRVEPAAIHLGRVPTRQAARDALGVKPDEFVAIVIGRLVPSKRIDEAIEHAMTLRPQRLIVVGSGPLSAVLERRYPAAELLGRLSRPRTLQWLAAADILVSGSRDEGSPTVVREARALGVPCWCAPSGDLRMWAGTDSDLRLFDQEPPQRSPSRGIRSTKLHGRVRLSS